MSGMVGLWRLDGHAVAFSEIAPLSAAIAHRGPDGEHIQLAAAFALAYQHLYVTPEDAGQQQPRVSPSGVIAAFDGRLDNREELLDLLASAPEVSPTAPDVSFALAAYARFGTDFAARLNGDFATAIFDPAERRLVIARDLMGLRPLYYCRLPRAFLFATEIKAILTHPEVVARPCDDALADLLLAGNSQCRDLTCFDGILRLVPGQLAVVTPAHFSTRQFWDFDPGRHVRHKRPGEYAEELAALFRQSVRRRLRTAAPVAISVSGGLDSSGIFCVAHAIGGVEKRITGFSTVYPDGHPADEKHFLLPLERQCNTPIERVPARAGYLDGARELLWHTEWPSILCQWNNQKQLLSRIQQHGARVMLTGIFGDQMLAGLAYITDLVQRLRWIEAARACRLLARRPDYHPKRLRASIFTNLMRAHFPPRLLPLVRRFRRGDRNRYPLWYTEAFRGRAFARAQTQRWQTAAFARHHAGSCYHQARAHIAGLESNNKTHAMFGFETWLPYLDRDLVALLMAVPGEMVNLGGIPKGLFREAMRGVLPEEIRQRDSKGDLTLFANTNTRNHFPEIRRIMSPDCLAVRYGYLDPAAVQNALEDMGQRLSQDYDGDPTRRLTGLLGLELWLQNFFGEGRTSFQVPTIHPEAMLASAV